MVNALLQSYILAFATLAGLILVLDLLYAVLRLDILSTYVSRSCYTFVCRANYNGYFPVKEFSIFCIIRGIFVLVGYWLYFLIA